MPPVLKIDGTCTKPKQTVFFSQFGLNEDIAPCTHLEETEILQLAFKQREHLIVQLYTIDCRW